MVCPRQILVPSGDSGQARAYRGETSLQVAIRKGTMACWFCFPMLCTKQILVSLETMDEHERTMGDVPARCDPEGVMVCGLFPDGVHAASPSPFGDGGQARAYYGRCACTLRC